MRLLVTSVLNLTGVAHLMYKHKSWGTLETDLQYLKGNLMQNSAKAD